MEKLYQDFVPRSSLRATRKIDKIRLLATIREENRVGKWSDWTENNTAGRSLRLYGSLVHTGGPLGVETLCIATGI